MRIHCMNKHTLAYCYAELLPPIIKKCLKRIFHSNTSWYFKGNYDSWDEAKALSTGYDDRIILNKVLEATLKVKRGEAAYERDSVTFNKVEYSWPLLANLMWVAAKNNGHLNVLDFGGALGSTYFQNKKYLNDIPSLRWNIIEQCHYVRAGIDNIASDQLRFYETIEDCISSNKINVVILSGVLDIIEDPYSILDQLLELNIKDIIVDRSAFLQNNYDKCEDKIVMQFIKPEIFSAKLPFRILSFFKLRDYFTNIGNMKIHVEYESLGGKGKEWEFKGFLASKD
jgi:putative methyltransferase (TIGR04325 family)